MATTEQAIQTNGGGNAAPDPFHTYPETYVRWAEVTEKDDGTTSTEVQVQQQKRFEKRVEALGKATDSKTIVDEQSVRIKTFLRYEPITDEAFAELVPLLDERNAVRNRGLGLREVDIIKDIMTDKETVFDDATLDLREDLGKPTEKRAADPVASTFKKFAKAIGLDPTGWSDEDLANLKVAMARIHGAGAEGAPAVEAQG